jgi:hypothetical protein
MRYILTPQAPKVAKEERLHNFGGARFSNFVGWKDLFIIVDVYISLRIFSVAVSQLWNARASGSIYAT